LAFIEEVIVRAGWFVYPTVGWLDGLWRSAAFGLLHLFGGAPLRVCLALTLGGLWFTGVYLDSGRDVDVATHAHTLYNLLFFGTCLGYWAYTKKNPLVA
jgi:hypothetical protein